MTGPTIHVPNFGKPLPRITPEEAGVHAADIAQFVDDFAAKGLRIHTFLLVKDGKVYAEGYFKPYAPEQFQQVFSLSKSFTSTAFGIARAEGKIALEERVIDVFADEVKAAGITPSKELAALTFHDVLRMSTGQPEEQHGADLVTTFLKVPFTEMPGEKFRYNTMATYMCSAALKKKGIDLEAYLQEKLFDPMGISGLHWLRCAKGICTGGFGLSQLPEVIAKFGILVLNDGVWEGKRLIPHDWIELATHKRMENADTSNDIDWIQGYGYQFWMCHDGSFRGDGAYGQYCVMNREKNTVLAMTAYVDNMQNELNVYLEGLLPKMQNAPLPADPAADRELAKKLAALEAYIVPAKDDGSAVPEEMRTLCVPDPDQGKETAGYTILPDGETLKLSLHACKIKIKRGALRFYANVPYKMTLWGGGADTVTNAVMGWGMDGGKLVIRYMPLEYLEDLTIEVWMENGKVCARALDAHNPAEQREVFKA